MTLNKWIEINYECITKNIKKLVKNGDEFQDVLDQVILDTMLAKDKGHIRQMIKDEELERYIVSAFFNSYKRHNGAKQNVEYYDDLIKLDSVNPDAVEPADDGILRDFIMGILNKTNCKLRFKLIFIQIIFAPKQQDIKLDMRNLINGNFLYNFKELERRTGIPHYKLHYGFTKCCEILKNNEEFKLKFERYYA